MVVREEGKMNKSASRAKCHRQKKIRGISDVSRSLVASVPTELKATSWKAHGSNFPTAKGTR